MTFLLSNHRTHVKTASLMPSQARFPRRPTRSTKRLLYPYSLSYQPMIFTMLPTTLVSCASKMQLWGSPTMSTLTIGSLV